MRIQKKNSKSLKEEHEELQAELLIASEAGVEANDVEKSVGEVLHLDILKAATFVA